MHHDLMKDDDYENYENIKIEIEKFPKTEMLHKNLKICIVQNDTFVNF